MDTDAHRFDGSQSFLSVCIGVHLWLMICLLDLRISAAGFSGKAFEDEGRGVNIALEPGVAVDDVEGLHFHAKAERRERLVVKELAERLPPAQVKLEMGFLVAVV